MLLHSCNSIRTDMHKSGQLGGPESALNTQQGSTKYILIKKKMHSPMYSIISGLSSLYEQLYISVSLINSTKKTS